MCLLSTNGSLFLYHAINRLVGADHSLVKAPEPAPLQTSVILAPGMPHPPLTTPQQPTQSAQQQEATKASWVSNTNASLGATPNMAAPAGKSLFGAKPTFGATTAFGGGFAAKPGLDSSAGFGGFGAKSGMGGSTSFGALAAAINPAAEQVSGAYHYPSCIFINAL